MEKQVKLFFSSLLCFLLTEARNPVSSCINPTGCDVWTPQRFLFLLFTSFFFSELSSLA